jgi:hypothetical protein
MPSVGGATSIAIGDAAFSGNGYDIITIGNGKLPSVAAGFSANGVVSIGNSMTFNGSYVTTFSVQIGSNITNTNNNAVVIGYGALANGFGNSQSVTIGAACQGNGTNSVSIGYSANNSSSGGIAVGAFAAISGTYGIAIGVSSSAGSSSIAIGRYTTSVTNAISICGINSSGSSNSVTGTGTVNLNWLHNSGGNTTATNCILINATGSTVGSGFLSGTPSQSIYFATGGNTDISTTESNQIIFGTNIKPRLFGQVQFRGTRGFENTAGDSQSYYIEARTKTTNATATKLWLNYTDYVTGTKSLLLQASSLCYFEAFITARSSADKKVWKITGAIGQDGSVATTAFVGTPTVTEIGATAGASAWAISADANTTLGSLDFTGTGVAATTIHWYAKVDVVELAN